MYNIYSIIYSKKFSNCNLRYVEQHVQKFQKLRNFKF